MREECPKGRGNFPLRRKRRPLFAERSEGAGCAQQMSTVFIQKGMKAEQRTKSDKAARIERIAITE
jgi:hypothetical protein